MRALTLSALLLVPISIVGGQSTAAGGDARVGTRALLPREREIALARSAAPAATSDSATVYVLTTTGYEVAVQGTNGVACYVGRSWPESVEPHCYDAEGAATILPLAMRRVELLHQGMPTADAEREIGAALAEGRFRLPRRPVLSWMMSSAQRLINDSGKPVGSWRAHLMIYYPYLTAADLGLSGPPDVRHAILANPGRPDASIVIVVPEFITPAGEEARP